VSTFCKTYSDGGSARQAVEQLLAGGTPHGDIRLLSGCCPHDIRRESVGGFAGPVDPDATVGTFAGVVRRRRQGKGAFAGDPDRQRQGSFGDVDRDVIVTFARGAEHLRVATHRSLRRLLRPVALDGERADRLVDELPGGHGLVLAEVAPRARRDALAGLENPTRAA
jgi:hypothetical protein